LHQGHTFSKIAVVLDTGALLAKYYRLLPRTGVDIFTTSSAVIEVRDLENRQALLEAIELEVIRVLDPENRYVSTVLLAAKNTGSLSKLSQTDVQIAALALMLRDKYSDVVVITDDYELQNLLLSLKISFKPLRTRGITRLITYSVYCPLCLYTPSNPGETSCPFCGVPLVKRRLS